MDSFLFALGAIAPIVITVAIGYLLGRVGLMSGDFVKAANKLVFRVFLPATLFLNVYKIEALAGFDLGYVVYVVAVLLAVFCLSLPAVMAITRKRERRGALWQAAFRSNFALIGLPIAEALYGAEGLMIAALLSAAVVPLYNVLAVLALSVFGESREGVSVKKILLDILKNPLIIAVAAGVAALGVRALFLHLGVSFRLSEVKPIYTVLTYLSNLSTPLALLVLGAQFKFSAVGALKREIVWGTLMRNAFVPLFGVGIAYVFFPQFNGAHFAAFVSVFASPVAVSSVPMAQEMGADVELAGQLVVWTTLASAFAVFIASFLLRLAGVLV